MIELEKKLYYIQKEKNDFQKKYQDKIKKNNKYIILNEIKKWNDNPKFIINSLSYQRYDELNWYWNISILQKRNYEKLHKQWLDLIVNNLYDFIKKEKKIIEYKKENIKMYFIYLQSKEKENEKIFSNFNFKWIKDKITLEKLRMYLNIQLDYLSYKNVDIKLLKKCSKYFEYVNYENSHPIFWSLFIIKEFIKNIKKFKKRYLDNKKWLLENYKHESFFWKAWNINTKKVKNYLQLNFFDIENIKEKENLIRLQKKRIKKIKKEKQDYSYFQNEVNENLFELNKAKDYFKNNKNNIFKVDWYNFIYYIKKSTIDNLSYAWIFSIFEKYELSEDLLLKVYENFQIELNIKYLNYKN